MVPALETGAAGDKTQRERERERPPPGSNSELLDVKLHPDA